MSVTEEGRGIGEAQQIFLYCPFFYIFILTDSANIPKDALNDGVRCKFALNGKRTKTLSEK